MSFKDKMKGLQEKLHEAREKDKVINQLNGERKSTFHGKIQQTVGKIPAGSHVKLSFNPDLKTLNMNKKDITITLPYDRVLSFRVEDETTLAKSGGTVGRAMVGGALFGGTGAVVGGMSGKGNTKTRWIATLSYQDKEGNEKELQFVECSNLGSDYDSKNKSPQAKWFEKTIANIISANQEDVTEL